MMSNLKDSLAATPPAIELHAVRKSYAGREILCGVDLSIGRGEIFALVGPSGSGKSTLLKLVSGIETPDAGDVRLAGESVVGVPPYRRRVHTVFQNYALFPHLDVAGNVRFPLSVAGVSRDESRQRVERALGWVGLERFARRSVDALSGGERQRVALARALVDEPECVLLDEPLSALDPHLRGRTLELLQEIQARLRVTYLYVTHDREEALRAAHHVGVLNHGRLEQVGSPEEVYHKPATDFVASFVGTITWFDGELMNQQEQPGVRLASGSFVPLAGQAAPRSNRVRLGVRPEDVQLGDDGFVRAKVLNRQFAGATVSLRLQVENGPVLAAEVRNDARVPATDEFVGVRWEPRAAHLFSANEGT